MGPPGHDDDDDDDDDGRMRESRMKVVRGLEISCFCCDGNWGRGGKGGLVQSVLPVSHCSPGQVKARFLFSLDFSPFIHGSMMHGVPALSPECCCYLALLLC
jgi:hypothetical protein